MPGMKASIEERQVCPSGMFPARLIRITQMGFCETPWGRKHQVEFTWELSETLMEGDDPRPFVISKIMSESWYSKAPLYKLLKGWRGRDYTKEEKEAFDYNNLLGKCCLLHVVHEDKKEGDGKRAVAEAAMQMPQGQTMGEPVNDSYFWTVDNWNQEIYETFPEWKRDKIAGSTEGRVHLGGGSRPADEPQAKAEEDDVPF